ncbi:MAG: TetR/AcrR family transcriptional regulator [Sporichthyaceae bacterium]
MATSNSTKRPIDRRNRDADVVDAAIRVFYSKGYAGSTIQDVADAVGVLKGSLYHYISSKEDLLFRILQESHVQARATMAEVAALEVTPLERLRIYLERIHHWYLTNVERVSVYLNQQHHLTGDNEAQMRASAREFEHYLRELLAEAKSDGALRPDLDLKLAAFFILGALNSLPNWFHPDGEYSPDHVASEFSAMALHLVARTD